MYLFGSKLIKKHFSDFREPNDTDWVTNDQSKLKPSKIGEEEYYYIPNSPDREMTPNEIYTVKVSHAIYDIHWKKTMSDIRFLQIKGCKIIPDFLKSLRTHWELIHGVQVRTDFEVEPGNFFEDRVRRKLEITTLLEKGQSMPNFISNIHLSIISKIRNKKDKFNFRKMKINNREFRIRKKQFIDGVVSKIKSRDDADLTEAQMLLYAVKQDTDPDGDETRQAIKEMRRAVKAHNKKFKKNLKKI